MPFTADVLMYAVALCHALCMKALAIIDKVGDELTIKYSRMKQLPNITENDEDFKERYCNTLNNALCFVSKDIYIYIYPVYVIVNST